MVVAVQQLASQNLEVVSPKHMIKEDFAWLSLSTRFYAGVALDVLPSSHLCDLESKDGQGHVSCQKGEGPLNGSKRDASVGLA